MAAELSGLLGASPAGVGDQQGSEHPGGHRRHAGLHQDRGEALDEGADGVLVAFGWLLRHWLRAFLPAGTGGALGTFMTF